MQYNFHIFLFLAIMAAVLIILGSLTSNNNKIDQIASEDEDLKTKIQLSNANFLLLSDTHSMVKGRCQERHVKIEGDCNDDINFGDILSFFYFLKHQIDSNEEKDLWLILNGGFLHGPTMLGRQDPPTELSTILEHLPFDLINLGIDEVESSKTVELLQQTGGLVDWWGPSLVTSNIYLNSTNEAFGNDFHYLVGDHSKILSFGFLLDSSDNKEDTAEMSDLLIQKKVSETITSKKWFHNELEHGDFDMILIMTQQSSQGNGNDVKNCLKILLNETRNAAKRNIPAKRNVPIQFVIGGNNGGNIYDEIFQSDISANAVVTHGKNFDSADFVSIDLRKNAKNNIKDIFHHKMIDTTRDAFSAALGEAEGILDKVNAEGIGLKKYINRKIDAMGGNEIIGCAPKTYHANAPLKDEDSLLKLYLKYVVSNGLFQHLDNELKDDILLHRIEGLVQGNIYQGAITMDDMYGLLSQRVGDDTLQKIGHNIKGEVINELRMHLSSNQSKILNGTEEVYAYNLDIKFNETYELYAPTSDVPQMLEYLKDNKVDGAMLNKEDKKLVKDDHGNPFTLRQIWINFVEDEWEKNNHTECSSPTKSESSSSHPTRNQGEERGNTTNIPSTTNSSSPVISSSHYDEKKNEKERNEGNFLWFLVALVGMILMVHKYKYHLPVKIPGFNDDGMANNLPYNQPYGGNNVMWSIGSKFKKSVDTYLPSVNFNKVNSSFSASPQFQHQPSRTDETISFFNQQQQQAPYQQRRVNYINIDDTNDNDRRFYQRS